MNRQTLLGGCLAICLLVTSARAEDPMTSMMQMDQLSSSVWASRFGRYGNSSQNSISFGPGAVRLRVPANRNNASEVGLYSYFALAGDFEITATYELLSSSVSPRRLRGRVGLAVDAEQGAWHGSITRTYTPGEGLAYLLESTQAAPAGNDGSSRLSVAATGKEGRMGLRRLGNRLVFLAANGRTAPLAEVGQLPCTERAIRTVRLFADAGEPPAGADVRLSAIEIRAEEITAGIPRTTGRTTAWGLLASLAMLIVAVAAWFWIRHGRAASVSAK